MVFKIHVSSRAEDDTINALDYYDKINPALGSRFLYELQDTYQKIRDNPQYYSYISPEPNDKFRDVKMKSFPYLVIYEVYNEDIYISAVMHTFRKPFFI